jgi:hypothetical protein
MNKIFYNPQQYPLVCELAKYIQDIKRELDQVPRNVLDIYRPSVIWSGSSSEEIRKYLMSEGWLKSWNVKDTNPNQDWLNYPLIVQGNIFPNNVKHCPILTKLLLKHKNIINIAGYSWMKPYSYIPPHTDTTGIQYGSLALHIGLDVPSDCVLTVSNIDIEEKNFRAIVFDSTFTHSAVNNSSEDRVILYIDFKIG